MCVSKVQHMTGWKTGCNRARPVYFGFSNFQQMSQLATEKFQNLCNHNWWSGLLRLGSVRFRSFSVQQTGPANTTCMFIFHQLDGTCFLVVITIHYGVVVGVAGQCGFMVGVAMVVVVLAMVGSHKGKWQWGGKGWTVLCLFGTCVKQTNNTCQINWILLHSVPANSAEHSSLSSRMPKFCWND